jgi:LCP family protein required for cell wall assembly
MNTKQLIAVIIAVVLLGGILGAAYISLSLRISGINEEIEELSSGLEEEIEKQHTQSQNLLRNQQTLIRNMRNTRKALNMPVGTYHFPDQDQAPAEDDGRAGSSDDSIFYRAIDGIAEFYVQQELERILHGFVESNRTELLQMGSMNTAIREKSGAQYVLAAGGHPVVTIEASPGAEKKTPRIACAAYNGGSITVDLTVEKDGSPASGKARFSLSGKEERSLLSFIREEKSRFLEQYEGFESRKERLSTLLQQEDVRTALANKNLTIQKAQNGTTSLTYSLRSERDGEEFLSFGATLNGSYSIQDSQVKNYEKLRSRLLESIRSYDNRSPREIKVAEAKQQVLNVAKDPAFQAYLKQKNLRISTDPREDLDYYYFDLLREDGSLYGSFAVLKKVGDIYLADDEDVVISSLKSIRTTLSVSSGNGSKQAAGELRQDSSGSLPEDIPEQYAEKLLGGDGVSTILLCGTHKNNADTIIIARMKKGEGIALLSVPRDLYYEGRKLSSYYRIYGMERFRTLAAELTGVKIDGYVEVDMYAFIDIVDILGGISVTLEEPLIDPTYKIRDHGEWKTLYYQAGEHHLDGIEALRIARSRHTSDDFDRAHRQQLLLDALRDKISRIHTGKLDELYEVFRTLNEYINTDFSAYEMAQLFLSYRSTPIEKTAGLSTDNVLYATYSNLYHQGLTEEEVSDDFNKGAWIVLPKENNWTLIKWFARNTFEEL